MTAKAPLIRRLDSRDPTFSQQLDELLAWDVSSDDEVNRIAAEVISAVKAGGDSALLDYTRRFDRLDVATAGLLELSRQELEQALDAIDDEQRTALESAAQRIRSYHEKQKDDGFSYEDEHGNVLGQRVLPLDRVGVYVPGGQAAYPSTVLMTVIPAKVAGVSEIVMTVPTPNGVRSDLVLAAALIAGADRIFTVGGAQAIAALAYGTETIPRVDKIVGPGGAFVAAAKRLVFGPVGIDVIAGPSEVLVISDGSERPDWLALDLFSQAEHDEAAQAIAISPDVAHLDRIEAEMELLLPSLSRRDIAQASLSRRGALIHCSDLAEAAEIANRIAPEHLELALRDPDAMLSEIRHAGAIFIGAHTPEVMGDYVAGPSHVLPTFGTARYGSPLGVYDFQKRSSVIRLSPAGSEALVETASVLARGEGLEAHALSAEARRGANEQN
ncbi:MAG: histidinol dehydrogenase [Pseudomonadaceae bacterium]|nr:histidinol dehydrogenase [Pseudomonadaceae bacterium]